MTARGPRCRPEALELLGRHLPTLDTTDSLLAGAVAISLHGIPEARLDDVDEQIQNIADAILQRTRSREPRALVAHAHAHFFEELEFRGNVEDYLDPANSYIPAVLATRRGLPISLVLVYKAVLERIGLQTHGIGAPGHFLARVEIGETSLLVDPFHGGVPLTQDEAYKRMEAATGKKFMRDDYLLRPVTHHMWLFRILNNLEICFQQSRRTDDQLAMQELKGKLYGV